MGWLKTPVIIRRRDGVRALNPRQIWEYRDLLWLLGTRELKLRYRQTALGVAWVVFQPLLGAAVIAFVFGRVAGLQTDGVPYIVIAFTGLIGWSAFNLTVTRATTCLVNQPQLITKVSFPRLVVPLSAAVPAAVDFGVSLCVLVPLLFALGLPTSAGLALVPVWLGGILALALGLGFFLSSLAVSYRDVQHLLPFALQILLFASPVAYATDAVPASVRPLYRLNPLTVMIDGLRAASLGRETLLDRELLTAVVLIVALFLGGWLFFVRAERRFADVI